MPMMAEQNLSVVVTLTRRRIDYDVSDCESLPWWQRFLASWNPSTMALMPQDVSMMTCRVIQTPQRRGDAEPDKLFT